MPPGRDLIRGLWSWGEEIIFALHHKGGETAALVGTQQGGRNGLRAYVAGRLPGAELLSANPAELAEAITRLRHGIALLGTPSRRSAGLDGLIEALADGEWLFVVAAQPMTADEMEAGFSQVASEDAWLVNSYLRPGTLESTNSPQAKSYHELLTLALELREEGRREGMWRVRAFVFADEEPRVKAAAATLVSTLGGEDSQPEQLRWLTCTLEQDGFLNGAPATELPTSLVSRLCQLPRTETPGFRVRAGKPFGAYVPRTAARPLELGQLTLSGRIGPTCVSLPADALTRHAFITGMTGSGKTETAKALLLQLWQAQRIPFLVLEPAKREYRALLSEPGLEDMLVFTLGEEREAPFRLNPLEVPAGVPVQTHVDLVRTLFRATFAGLYPPLPYILEQALLNCYRSQDWDLARDVGGCGRRSPTLRDLRREADLAASHAGYGRELEQNVRAALCVRLDSLLAGGKGCMFDCESSISFDALLERPTLLELAAIGDPEVVSFLIGALVVRLYETLLFAAAPCDTLRHVTLLEEAHHLLAGVPPSATLDASSIQTHAVEVFCRLLSEVRALGEGVVIVDQSPAKLHPDVLRGTNTKLAHRLVAADDRKAAGSSMNMTRDQVRALATLSVGEAAYFPEGVDHPVLVQITPRASRGRATASIRKRMEGFYHRHPGITASAQDGPEEPCGHSATAADIGALTREIEALIASTPPGELWRALAARLRAAANGTGDSDLEVLRLGFEVGDRLDLAPETRSRFRATLAAVITAAGERSG